jgi:hypothetical protein
MMTADGDRCSICKADLPHNSRTFGGVTAGGDTALVGQCCEHKIKEIVLTGLYVSHGYEGLIPRPNETPAGPMSAAQTSRAINTMQQTFQKIDQVASSIATKGGVPSKMPRINTASSPWKDDDAGWFKANKSRAHRLRPAFPGEIDALQAGSDKDEPPPIGHEFQILVRQVEPGTRMRIVFCRNMEVPIPDLEPLIHAIFDVISASKGGVVSSREVADLAMQYAASGGSASQN